MPQVKGNWKWVDNPKTEPPIIEAKIDNSEIIKENERVQEEGDERVMAIHLQGHKVFIQTLATIKEAKREAEDISSMKELVKNPLQRSCSMLVPMTSSSRDSPSLSYRSQSLSTLDDSKLSKKLSELPSILKKRKVSTDSNRSTSSSRSRRSSSVNTISPASNDVFEHEDIKPLQSHTQSSRRVSVSTQGELNTISILDVYDAHQRRRRLYRGALSSTNTIKQGRQEIPSFGRSYHELKHLADIDRAHQLQKQKFKELIKERKDAVLESHHENVREKLRRFYVDVEQFKGKDSVHEAYKTTTRPYERVLRVY